MFNDETDIRKNGLIDQNGQQNYLGLGEIAGTAIHPIK